MDNAKCKFCGNTDFEKIIKTRTGINIEHLQCKTCKSIVSAKALEPCDNIINIECKKCNCNLSIVDKKFKNISNCTFCINTTNGESIEDIMRPPVVTCPYCNSTNTKKISNISKISNVTLFGVFALGKITKQWHCNNCKSDF